MLDEVDERVHVQGTEEVRVSASSMDSSTNIQDRFLLGASLLATFLPFYFLNF